MSLFLTFNVFKMNVSNYISLIDNSKHRVQCICCVYVRARACVIARLTQFVLVLTSGLRCLNKNVTFLQHSKNAAIMINPLKSQ